MKYPMPDNSLRPQIVFDGIMNWDIGRAYFDDESIKYTNSGSNLEKRLKTHAVFAWVDIDDFIHVQKVIFASRGIGSRNEFRDGIIPEDIGEYRFNAGVTGVYGRGDVEELKGLMQSGAVFHALFLNYDYDGYIIDEQEGRRRSTAAKELGVKKVPVWFIIEKKAYKDRGYVFQNKFPLLYLKSIR